MWTDICFLAASFMAGFAVRDLYEIHKDKSSTVIRLDNEE